MTVVRDNPVDGPMLPHTCLAFPLLPDTLSIPEPHWGVMPTYTPLHLDRSHSSRFSLTWQF